jgi:hypothetical protein
MGRAAVEDFRSRFVPEVVVPDWCRLIDSLPIAAATGRVVAAV